MLPVVFGTCHRRPGLRQARHSVRVRLLSDTGKRVGDDVILVGDVVNVRRDL